MKKISLSQQTARRLYSLIAAEKKLSPGEKLPNEVELSQEMGVSRATLREAIRELATQGVLEVRRGRGTFVSQQVEEINDFGFSSLDQVKGQLRDLFELRAVFEPEMAALACRRATNEELADILAQGERGSGNSHCLWQPRRPTGGAHPPRSCPPHGVFYQTGPRRSPFRNGCPYAARNG